MIFNKKTLIILLFSICNIIPLSCMDKKRSNDMIESSVESHDPKKQKMQLDLERSEQFQQARKTIQKHGWEWLLLSRIGHGEQDMRSPLSVYVINTIIAHVKPQLTGTMQSFLLSRYRVPCGTLFEGNNKLNNHIVFDPNERSLLFRTIDRETRQCYLQRTLVRQNDLTIERTLLKDTSLEKKDMPIRFQKFNQSLQTDNFTEGPMWYHIQTPKQARSSEQFNFGNGPFTVNHEKRITCFVIVNDRFASGSSDKKIQLSNKQTGECIGTLKGHKNAITTVQFSPDEKYLLSLSKFDKAIKIWDLETRQCLSTLHYEDKPWNVYSLDPFTHDAAFSPDGKHIISFSPTKGLIWNMESLYTLKQKLRDNDFSLPLTKLLTEFAEVGLSRKRKNKPVLTESQKNKLEQMGFNTSPSKKS